MTTTPPRADYYTRQGQMWRVVARGGEGWHRSAGPRYMTLQSMTGQTIDVPVSSGTKPHRCPGAIYKCSRCSPACGSSYATGCGGGWVPCEDLACINARGRAHDHHTCPCREAELLCDTYVASRPACHDCPSTWTWPPCDRLATLVPCGIGWPEKRPLVSSWMARATS